MKTVISIPDPLFHAAEELAKRTQRSRSQLYADALREYLTRQADEVVTEAMNRAVDRLEAASQDSFSRGAGRKALEHSEWRISSGSGGAARPKEPVQAAPAPPYHPTQKRH
jgi:metal-responsive CopG/Arc/MetJ family transcriptional regulator